MARQNVNFDITARNKTQKAFAGVSQNLKRMRSNVNQTVGRVGRIGAAFAIAGAGATAALVKMRMAAIDNLAKTADKLGVTTEALAGLRHAAELSGVSAQTFDKALQNMGVQIANAARGSGLAVRALSDLGLESESLTKLPLDQQMQAVAKAMQNVESHSDKVRIAYELFGARGVGVLNMMKDGGEAMASMAEEAQTLGIGLSRIDAAQVEAANDSVTRAKGVFEGFGNQITVALSPAIAELSANFYQTALDTNEAGNVGDRVARSMFKGFGRVGDAILGIKIAVMGIQFAFATYVKFFILGVSKIGSVIDYLIEKYNQIAGALGFDAIESNIGQNLQMLSDSFGETAEGIKARIQEALNSPLPSERIMEFFDNVQMKARETAEVVAANAPGAVLAEGAQDGADQAANATLATSSAMQTTVSTLLSTTQSQMSALQGIFAEGSAGAKAFFVLQQALAASSAIVNGFMAAMAIRAAYAQLAAMTGQPWLSTTVGEAHANFAQAMGFATAGMILGQTLASFEGGGFTGMGARAGGLDGKGGYMAMVHPNETIIDHSRGQEMPSQSANISFNIQANDSRGFDELLVQRRGLITNMVRQALNNSGKRLA